MRDDMKFIRECAAKGIGANRVAAMIGVTPAKFQSMISALDLSSLFNRESKTKTYTAFGKTAPLKELVQEFGVICEVSVRRRLKSGEGIEQALTRKPRCDYQRRLEVHVAFGKSGTIKELIEEFAVVTEWSVLDRLDRGMGIELALTLPRRDQEWAHGPKQGHPWREAEQASYDEYLMKKKRRLERQSA